jgi:hypothetical protein
MDKNPDNFDLEYKNLSICVETFNKEEKIRIENEEKLKIPDEDVLQ